MIEHALKNLGDRTLEEVLADIDRGGAFVIYQYAISGVITFVRPTSIQFVPSSGDRVRAGRKFTILSLLLGWWGLYGPIRTVQSIRINMSGGLDVTDDVVRSLTPESFLRAAVIFEAVHMIFEPASPHNRTAIVRALTPLFNAYGAGIIRRVYLGMYMDAMGEPPDFVIGIDGSMEFDQVVADALVKLRSPYGKHVRFEFLSIGDDEISIKLIEQGERIYGDAGAH